MAAAFLTYLTVFKSRLGVVNIVVQASGFVHQPDAALLRKVRTVLEQTEPLALDDPANEGVFQYLKDKELIGRRARTRGRYTQHASLEPAERGWIVVDRRGERVMELPTFMTDIWLSRPDIRSTIGVPTPENAGEAVELGYQLRVVSKSTNTWTAAGQLTAGLRERCSSAIVDPSNPFLLGAEAVAFLRQLVATDGRLMLELVREIVDSEQEKVTRDDLAAVFPDVVARAVELAKTSRVSPPNMREAREFLKLIRDTASKAKSRERQRRPTRGAGRQGSTSSRGPGVLEHRVAPRLEWLTDLGYLAKEWTAKNAFEYRTTEALDGLLTDMDDARGEDDWAEVVAVSQWRRNPTWDGMRPHVAMATHESAMREAYKLMKRRIGPAPLREVAVAAALMSAGGRSYRDALGDLISFAQQTDGGSLSGGRYRRGPENIHLPDSAL